ncbi:MAG: hypothetical protein J6A33_06840 [Alphaproteobacteria bacterium]|nr:hypothetical protein [Alphaproteobacteria bacterium]
MTIINLEILTQGRTTVLGSKVKGADAREKFGLDELDKNADSIDVLIPDYIVTFTPSFFLGLFSKSLDALGEEKFFLKYHFKNAREIIQKQILSGVDDWKCAR